MNIRKPVSITQTRSKYGIPENAKLLVTAGILNRGKNIETLLGCVRRIDAKEINLLIVGDGSRRSDFRYKDFLLGLADNLEVDDRIHFTGWLEKEHLWEIFLASDLFVLPSLSEGMPNVLLEALGLNLACMGSWIPGIKDILQYEELMFDPKDEKALANKITRFFSDGQHASKVLQLCHERRKEFFFNWKQKAFQMVTQRPYNGAQAWLTR